MLEYCRFPVPADSDIDPVATSQLVTRSAHGQLVTHASRQRVNSSQVGTIRSHRHTGTYASRHTVNLSHMRLTRQSTRHK